MDKVISLNIVNSQMLDAGLLPYIRFTKQGGVIGSSPGADWQLKHRLNEVKAQQCRILWLDEQFCVEDLCGEVFVNQSSMPIGLNRMASLNENDEISIGPYKVRISLGSENERSSAMTKQLSEMFDEQALSDLTQTSALSAGLVAEVKLAAIDDPMQALDALEQQGRNKVLSFTSLDPEQETEMSLIDSQLLGSDKELTMQADSEYTQDSAIALKKHTYLDNFTMDEKTLDLLESELHTDFDKNSVPSIHPVGNHLTAGPLFRGLGVQLGDVRDSEQMQAISVDLGASLKAAISGILSLHDTASQGRYQLMNKNLQPIEDNPLRLGLNYEDTVKTLFDDDRSPVHLSSASAITESLQSVEQHNQAVQTAISEALDYILMAFSPEKLLKRFSQYRKSSDANLETGDKWAWSMYEKYYAELTSNRQKGFEKLFWEVFEQAYDRKLRELQRDC
ncbi:type VI secretion system-associated FHA domain protein TagH [Shewanella psychropiezotolerans]|uniref:Type VI secretion system-associated FHA domain protein TagH n=1 Tax=Shewanella psychropiezotolerans TaxID=2593655 RepID=A0ABX5WYU7_9GAMM|nr:MULTISPECIES: type VI secretion system-associated FHA domain protein TagH [Shewanella]MPY24023.1 type VI secretion system-associated FHA domain protein TagH [Shewanella sp. YLB-07]QDO84274.1 type VI secretion system-associated FHA domain protein TagH [Shewanella psychropiezotolerans]